MKSVLLIGLGRFGCNLAAEMHDLHSEVMAIDRDESAVNTVLDFTTSALIGDGTDEQFIASLGVRNFDVCIVAIGEDFRSSLETTALLKDCGAQKVVARASSVKHEKFLLRNGADAVIYPEREAAHSAAVIYSLDHVFNCVGLTGERSIFEVAAPQSWVGQTIAQKAVRTKYGISILAVKKGNDVEPLPTASYRFSGSERLVVLARERAIADLFEKE